MRNAFFLAGAFAVAMAFGPSVASAQSMQASENASVQTKSNLHAKSNVHVRSKTSAHVSGTRSLARADEVAGTHGAKGRANARLHGSHKTNFCPPGQAKKPGMGSRFQC